MKKIIIGAVTLGSSIILLFSAKPDGLLHVWFLNVGQGDAILMRTPAGENILMDGGPQNRVLKELKDTLPFGDRSIDHAMLTHTDRDHIEGLTAVLQRHAVGRVYITGAYKNDFLSNAFFKTISEKKIPAAIIDENSDFTLADDVTIDFIYPFTQTVGPREKTNDLSLIARITYGKNSILLTGDAEAPLEEILVKNRALLESDVLKIGHHGSNTSTTAVFLRAVKPMLGIISAGKNNEYGHPHAAILKRLAACGVDILRTDRDGRIEIVFSKTKIEQIFVYSPNYGKRTILAPSRRNFSSNCS